MSITETATPIIADTLYTLSAVLSQFLLQDFEYFVQPLFFIFSPFVVSVSMSSRSNSLFSTTLISPSSFIVSLQKSTKESSFVRYESCLCLSYQRSLNLNFCPYSNSFKYASMSFVMSSSLVGYFKSLLSTVKNLSYVI